MSSLKIPLKVTIASSSKQTPLALDVTLQNASTTQPLYLLTWSSPLDPKAAALGVFPFNSVSTGEDAPGMNLMFRRRTPADGHFTPLDEDILRIEASGTIKLTVEVGGGEVMLEKGERYLVKAKGRWAGVWIGEHERLAYDIEGADVLMGDFESEGLEITAS